MALFFWSVPVSQHAQYQALETEAAITHLLFTPMLFLLSHVKLSSVKNTYNHLTSYFMCHGAPAVFKSSEQSWTSVLQMPVSLWSFPILHGSIKCLELTMSHNLLCDIMTIQFNVSCKTSQPCLMCTCSINCSRSC